MLTLSRFYPNRKSRNGSRPLSRVPRVHRAPPWSTSPPTARKDPVSESLDPMRRILRSMVLLVTDSSTQEKLSSMLENTDDVRLVALAQEAYANLKRAKTTLDQIQGELVGQRKELERIRKEFAVEERALLEAQKAIKERDDIAAKYKELQKQLDPEKQQLEIMYAIDEATAAAKEEATALRRELGQRQTEVNELRASKKRLREALDRLAGKD
jgi:chromosome segregation ATPase